MARGDRHWENPREAAVKARELLGFRTEGECAVFWRNDGSVQTLGTETRACKERLTKPRSFGLIGVYPVCVSLEYLTDDFVQALHDHQADAREMP